MDYLYLYSTQSSGAGIVISDQSVFLRCACGEKVKWKLTTGFRLLSDAVDFIRERGWRYQHPTEPDQFLDEFELECPECQKTARRSFHSG